jgi:amidohydrolase
MLKSVIRSLALELQPELVAIRRHLHANPELSFQEHQTAAFICKKLDELKIPYQKGLAGTGVIGIIRGKNPEKHLRAFRADMDALPIQEAGEKPYRSAIQGVMHACGHDVHTTCLLGLAHILQTIRDQWEGSIQLIFQPGEELLPGGASLLIKEGIFQPAPPEAIIAQHVHPPLEAGKVGFREGPYMASSDELYLTVRGKGGHGAMPQDCIDPISITAQIISGLQMVVSRNANPFTPSVLTFGRIQSEGGATNIIPNTVNLQGTFRTMDEAWRQKAHQLMASIVSGIAQSFGALAELQIVRGYPVLVNDPKLTARCRGAAEAFLGAENVVELPMRMTSEDFAWYSHHIPACFFRLGTGNAEKGISSPIHTDTFDIDESALSVGAGLMAWLAVAA